MTEKKNTWKIAIVILAIALLASTVAAVPIPLGIDGKIFELDSVTEVFEGVPVIINDTTSNIVIYTTTGKGSSGRYSVAINGESGDNVTVTTHNPLFQSTRSIILSGVIHDFDLTINMSLPPFAPNITSAPQTSTLEDEEYSYTVEAFDWNNDPITYDFKQGPSGMNFNQASRTAIWTPEQEDVGVHTIRFTVNDGNLTTEQEYSLEVVNVNDPPNIISTPITKATAGFEYVYQTVVVDEDIPTIEYSLLTAPENMLMSNSGRINWTPNAGQIGNHTIDFEFSDGEFTLSQEYLLEVQNKSAPEILSNPIAKAAPKQHYSYQLIVVDADQDSVTYELVEKPKGMTINNNGLIEWLPRFVGKETIVVEVSDGLFTTRHEYTLIVALSSHGGGSGGGSFPDRSEDEEESDEDDEDGEEGEDDEKEKETEDSEEETEESSDNPLIDIKVKGGAKSRAFKKRPKGVNKLQKLVYKYLMIERVAQGEGNAIVSFKVEKDWIKQRKIKKEDVILARYTNKWEDLPTNNVEEDESHEYYDATTPGFSYFAITIKETARPEMPQPAIKKIKEPFLIFGQIYTRKGKGVPGGTPIVIENENTGEIIYGLTSDAANVGYSVVLHGSKNDKVKISILGDYKGQVVLRLKNSKTKVDIRVRSTKGFSQITGMVISAFTGQSTGEKSPTIALIMFSLAGMFILSILMMKKSNWPRK